MHKYTKIGIIVLVIGLGLFVAYFAIAFQLFTSHTMSNSITIPPLGDYSIQYPADRLVTIIYNSSSPLKVVGIPSNAYTSSTPQGGAIGFYSTSAGDITFINPNPSYAKLNYQIISAPLSELALSGILFLMGIILAIAGVVLIVIGIIKGRKR
ncbi:MAG: hypothetical protein RXQ22_09885 [Sulfolobus sp.]